MAQPMLTEQNQSSLPGAFGEAPSPRALSPSIATQNLVESQVDALLASSGAYHELPQARQAKMKSDLVKIAAYAAECVRDDWYQSERIGQRPVIRKREVIEGPVAEGQSASIDPNRSAAGQSARIIQDTLRAISFPTFVADLIRGTFNAITQSSIQQMEAYMRLLENVSMTVDQFMNENISDNQARDYLASRYPDHIHVQTDGGQARALPREGADERPAPNFQQDLGLRSRVELDESTIEETLVPAARRKLAQSRLQLLSTLVLMGINRIVVTGGKIRAAMNFHIATTDTASQQHATDFDTRASVAGSYGFGPWSVSASVSVAYVSSDRSQSTSGIETDTTLQSEVEIHFKSDYFPLERFANNGTMQTIQNNTAVPEANAPFSAPPATGDTTGASAPRQSRLPTAPPPATLPPIGEMRHAGSAPLQPTAPTAPDSVHPVRRQEGENDRAAREETAREGTAREETGREGSRGGSNSEDRQSGASGNSPSGGERNHPGGGQGSNPTSNSGASGQAGH